MVRVTIVPGRWRPPAAGTSLSTVPGRAAAVVARTIEVVVVADVLVVVLDGALVVLDGAAVDVVGRGWDVVVDGRGVPTEKQAQVRPAIVMARRAVAKVLPTTEGTMEPAP
jgi:hypothetical protein